MATLTEYEQLRKFAQVLALALAEEAMYLKQYSEHGPSEFTLDLLSRARNELSLAETFDNLDGLKPLIVSD